MPPPSGKSAKKRLRSDDDDDVTPVPQPKAFELFCLLEGDEDAFSVNVTPEQSISSLKDAIKAKNEPELRDVSAAKLQLWKIRMPVEELEKAEPSIEKLEKLRNTKKISHYWKDDALADQTVIHIFVAKPSLPPLPSVEKLLNDSPGNVYFLQLFEAMFRHLWGQEDHLEDIRHRDASGQAPSEQYLNFGYYLRDHSVLALPQPLELCNSKVYIRESYRKLRKVEANKYVITGTPGIGKSTYLWYHLVHRISEAQPCAWIRSDITFVIDKDGVSISRGSLDRKVWIYLDFDAHLVAMGAPPIFWSHKDYVAGVIVSSSPVEQRWYHFYKQDLNWDILLMPPWSEEELIFTIRLLYSSSGVGDERIYSLIRKFGTAPRTIFNILSHPAVEEDRWNTIYSALPSLATFIKLRRTMAAHIRADPGSHKLFELKPTAKGYDCLNDPDSTTFPKYQGSVVGFRSQDLVMEYVQSLRDLEHDNAVQQYRNLRSIKEFSSGAGASFEALSQICLFSGGTFSLYTLRPFQADTKAFLKSTSPVLPTTQPNPPESVAAIRDRINGRLVQKIELLHAGERLETFSLSDITVRFMHYPLGAHVGKLQVPCVSNWPSSDFFVVTADRRVILFQCTVGETHPVKASGLELLQKHLHPDLHPTKTRKWILCFVTPLDTTHETFGEQSITIRDTKDTDAPAQKGKKSVKNWEPLLEQLWLPLEDGLLFSPAPRHE